MTSGLTLAAPNVHASTPASVRRQDKSISDRGHFIPALVDSRTLLFFLRNTHGVSSEYVAWVRKARQFMRSLHVFRFLAFGYQEDPIKLMLLRRPHKLG